MGRTVVMLRRALALGLVFFAVAACGGTTQGASDAGTTDAGGACPATAPADGDDCEGTFQCEYGDDPRWVCNTVATCKQGFWSIAAGGGSDCPTPATNPAACSQLQPNTSCSDTSVSCRNGDSFCACILPGALPIVDGGAPSPVWMCGQPGAGCPSSRPKLGTACAQPNLECSYAPCGTPSGLDVECDASTSTWVGTQEFCAGAN